MEQLGRKQVGRLGESIAAEFLVRKGFSIIERNYLKPWGEIDIIAEKQQCVRFVEVKTIVRNPEDVSRENIGYRPEELLHDTKIAKVARTAELYMAGKKDEREYQIDAVTIILNLKDRTAGCRLYEQIL